MKGIMLTLPVMLTLFNFLIWCISMLAMLISINIFQIFGLKLKIQTNENLTGCLYFRRQHMITRVFKILTWIASHFTYSVKLCARTFDYPQSKDNLCHLRWKKNNNIINCDWCIFITFGLQYKKTIENIHWKFTM